MDELVEDLRTIIEAKMTEAKLSIVECWHGVGERIANDPDYKKRGKSLFARLANCLSVSERSLYYAVKFYEAYPDMSLLPMGANWNRIVTNLLPAYTGQKPEPGPWTKTKFLWTVDLERLNGEREAVMLWREQGIELYDRISKKKAEE